MKKWTIGSPDPAAVEALRLGSDLSDLCCRTLVAAGCVTLEEANRRIGCHALSDPSLLCDMQQAADLLLAAADSGKRICVYGDYDCDGVMATVILYSYLYEMGADVTWRIPERAEGYGLNMQAIREMHEDGVALIVTVDNGISANAEAAYIRELGMELIVTDHHQPGAQLPDALAVVDAHRQDNFSPFRLYCGAGIALLLVAAMCGGDTATALEQFGDLAAVATIADIVSLTGENRYLVQMGLAYLENTERPGLIALRQVAGLTGKPLTSQRVAFAIAPRINAAGRMASPRLAAELLLCEDPAQAQKLAAEIDALNTARKAQGEEILREIRAQIAAAPRRIYERVLVFAGEGWNTGIIGIAAARMQELCAKPCIIIGTENGVGHGSARGFGDFSVFGCLTACGDLLDKYGGHPGAGGFTIRADKIPAFAQRVAEYAAAHHPVMPAMEIRCAGFLKADMLKPDVVRSLSVLEPFGTDNPEPLFVAQNVRVVRVYGVGEKAAHARVACVVDGVSCNAMIFGMTPEETKLHPGFVVHMLVRLAVNTWNGRESVSLIVQDYRNTGVSQNRMLSGIAAYDAYRRGETLPPAYYKAALPTRRDFVGTYIYMPVVPEGIEEVAMRIFSRSINYFKFRICLDVFAELGLVVIAEDRQTVRVVPDQHVELENSRILKTITALAKEDASNG